jgi:phosphoglycerate dehydrogenase-like enzyme
MKVVVMSTAVPLADFVPGLRRDFPHVDFVVCTEPSRLPGLMADAEIYVGPVGPDVARHAPRLKWVQSISTGVDSMLAVPELARGDVLLTGARGTHSACLAESVFGMIFAFTRGILDSAARQQHRQWAQRDLRGGLRELSGSMMGLIGYGAMARAIAARARAFDMRVTGVDLMPVDGTEGVTVRGMDGLDDLLAQSDYLVVTVPSHAGTRGMLGARALGLMKPEAILIGISRGGVIDEQALAEALRAGRLRAAALDVFETEPLPADSDLWDVKNLLITPHIAGGTQFEGRNVAAIFRENLERFLRGSLPLRNQVDKARGY